MNLSRRTFLGGAAAFAVAQRELLAAGPTAQEYEVNGHASDFVLCRRLYLDVCGRIPTRAEAEAYLASKDFNKYKKLVDELLESEDYADYWAMRYCDTMRVKSEFPINLWPNAVYVYHRRVRASIANDEPWDDFTRALLSGRGSNFRVPESNFLRATARKTPEGISEAVTTTLLLEPTEKYARFFSRVGYKSTREWKEEIVFLKPGPADDTPEAFYDHLQGPLREKFHQTPVKRVHWWLFGDLPRADRLSSWTAEFEHGGLRLKHLLRHVLNSSAYRAGPIRGKFPSRRLDAEVLDDAICSITGMIRSFRSIAPEPFSFLPPRRKSVLVEDGSITSAFLLLFGSPARDTGRLEERDNTITAKQRLYLYNSSKIWKALGEMTGASAFKELPRRQQVEDLYWRFLGRPPSSGELTFLDDARKVPIRDVAWHLLNTREFLYRI